jgi:REP element-mobilizing transposase RayT
MKYNPDIHHRRSIRLKGYDYSRAGMYFVTICAQDRKCFFGSISGEKMSLNKAGRLIQEIWDAIPEHYSGVTVDEFVVMPNHVHGIIVISPMDIKQSLEIREPQGNGIGQPQGVAPTIYLSLPDVVHRFKTLTTKQYADGVRQHEWPQVPGKLRQRNYWEHIVRNESELTSIREYIQHNPAQWKSDTLYFSQVGAYDYSSLQHPETAL